MNSSKLGISVNGAIMSVTLFLCFASTTVLAEGICLEGEIMTLPLRKGCFMDEIGWITIAIEGNDLVVEFAAPTIDPEVWLFDETQLYLGWSVPSSCDYTAFPWKHPDLGGALSDEYRIHLTDLVVECGETLYLVARAVISGEETWAWDENCTLISDGCCGQYCPINWTFGEGAAEWPMFCHDLQRTGYTPLNGPARNFTLWTFETGDNVFSSPAVAGGRIYFGSRDNSFYCLNSTSGAHLWNFTARSTPQSPAVAYGLVYFGSADFRVYCLNATTGELVWEFMTGYNINACPAVHGGRVYIGSQDRHFYCLDAFTGDLLWKFESKGAFISSSAALKDGRVYVGCTDTRLLCLDASSGTLIWQFEAEDAIHSSPALYQGRVYFGSMDGKVYCLDATDGSMVWNYTTGYWVLSSPAVADGRVYAGSNDKQAYCLNASTGALIWKYNTGIEVPTSPAIANETVYFTSYGAWVYCLDAVTGALIWHYDGRGFCYSSPAVADGRLYTGFFDHRMHAIGSQDFGFATDTGDLVSVSSNSFVSGFQLDDPKREFSFSVSGKDDTRAFVNVTFPRGLAGDAPSIYADGSLLKPLISSNSTHISIYAEFAGDVRGLRIASVPELLFLPGLLLVVAALLVISARRR